MSINYYTVGKIEYEIFFPEDKVKCQNCRYCYEEKGLRRFRCGITDYLIYEPSENGLPDVCPAKLTGEIRGTRKD